MNKIKILFLLLAFLPVFSCVRSDDDLVEEYIHVGDILPEFSVNGLDGAVYDSSQAEGKVTLICFFHTGCPDCHRELPGIQYAMDELSAFTDFEVVCIGRDMYLPDIKTYWDENTLTMPYYEDPERSVYRLFASITIPRIYLIDRDSKVVEMWVEKIQESDERFLRTIRAYVENP